jgi:LPS sulfotransferase NodH
MRVRRSLLICFVARSGSTYLCGLLASTGVLGRPWEYFWAPNDGVANPGLDDVLRRGSTANGVFGCKFQLGQWNVLLERERLRAPGTPDRELVEQLFPNPLYVRLRRDDRIAQAISWSRAIQTTEWSTNHPASGKEPRYDCTEIAGLLELIDDESEDWDAWFAHAGIEPHEMTYESVHADPRAAVAGIARAVGVALPDDVELRPYPGWERQSDALNEEWARRFRTEAAS